MNEINSNIKRNNIRPRIFILALLLIVDTCFFDLPSISDALIAINNPHNKLFLCIIVVVLFSYSALSRKVNYNRKEKLDNLIVYYITIVFITFFISIIRYNQDIIAVARNYHYYMLLLLYFWLKKWVNNERSYKAVIKTIIIVSVIYSIILITSKIVFEISGSMILNSNILTVTTRNNSLRLQHTAGIVPYGCVLAGATALKERKKRKLLYIVFAVICAFDVIWITQTRMSILAILVATGISIYLASSRKNKWGLAILIIFIVTAFSESILKFIGTFNVESEDSIYAYSMSIRLEAYKHFIKHMFHNGIIGIGFINSDRYSFLKYGPYGRYALSDLGYIGVIGVFGILGVILIVALIWYLVGFYKQLSEKNAFSKYPETVAISLYLLISSWSLIFNDIQRLFYFPIILILINYSYNKIVEINMTDYVIDRR